jgi:hypothetical protein
VLRLAEAGLEEKKILCEENVMSCNTLSTPDQGSFTTFLYLVLLFLNQNCNQMENRLA